MYTITRTHGVEDRLKYAARVVHGVEVDVNFDLEGLTDRNALERCLSEKKVTNINYDRCFREMLQYYLLAYFQGTRFRRCPGARWLFRFCRRQGIPVGVVTGTLQGIAIVKMCSVGLRNFIHPAISAYGDDEHQDRSELVRVALEKARESVGFGIEHGTLWIIGDTPRDIQAGKAVKARTIGVATGNFNKAALELESPDLVVKNLWVERRKVAHLLLE